MCMYVSRLEIACDSEEFEICGCIYVPGRSYAASAEPANSPEAFFFLRFVSTILYANYGSPKNGRADESMRSPARGVHRASPQACRTILHFVCCGGADEVWGLWEGIARGVVRADICLDIYRVCM